MFEEPATGRVRVAPPPEFDQLYHALEALKDPEENPEEASLQAEEEHLAAYLAQRQKKRDSSRGRKLPAAKKKPVGTQTPPLPPRPPRPARAMSMI